MGQAGAESGAAAGARFSRLAMRALERCPAAAEKIGRLDEIGGRLGTGGERDGDLSSARSLVHDLNNIAAVAVLCGDLGSPGCDGCGAWSSRAGGQGLGGQAGAAGDGELAHHDVVDADFPPRPQGVLGGLGDGLAAGTEAGDQQRLG